MNWFALSNFLIIIKKRNQIFKYSIHAMFDLFGFYKILKLNILLWINLIYIKNKK